MATGNAQAKQQVEETIERIRALNEQVLNSGRESSQGFLDAYEQSMRTFADIHERAGQGADVEWIAEVAKAQADFARAVTKHSTDAARSVLK
jgi:hypothetical protein